MNPTELAEQARHRTVLDDEGMHVAHVYAEALYRAAQSHGQVDEVLGELTALIHEVFARSPEFELLLASTAISRERKDDILNQIFQGRASQTLNNFLRVLNAHDRLGLLRSLADAFTRLCEQRSGRIVVQVRSAVPLDDGQRGRLAQILREVSTREPILRETVDPALLGGLVVQVGDWVYDASVRTRLVQFRTQLIERSSHGITGG
jgi:F-type H+-transporting ATPase subunit delta